MESFNKYLTIEGENSYGLLWQDAALNIIYYMMAKSLLILQNHS